jgi:sugar phosphate isomerase/epimerase
VEFHEVEGRIGFDNLMARTDPELVKIELDVGWVAVAGHDPVAYMNRYAGRVIGCHLKDFLAGAPLPDSGGIGTWRRCDVLSIPTQEPTERSLTSVRPEPGIA